jgi:AAHS family 4-hydroxybenzoate transporter-like MFS transporter
MSKTVDVAEIIASQPFGPFHVRIIVLCLLIQFLDGFDTQALAFAGPALRDAWGLGPQGLGTVVSLGAIGTGIGSICMGFLADIFGRKRIIIASVTVFGLLSLCTVLVSNVDELMIVRPLTGFGLGAALPLTFVMVNEFAPPRIRARMIAAMAWGFAIGAASGGLLQAELVPYFGWQGIFFVGGVLPLVLALALVLMLPESVRYLAARGGKSDEIARILKLMNPKLAFSPETEFVLSAEPQKKKASPALLFSRGHATTTMLLWFAFLVSLASLNTLIAFLPIVLYGAGLSQPQALRVTTLFQFGGIAGVWCLGYLADKFGYPKVIVLAFLGLSFFIAATGSLGPEAILLVGAVAGMGFCLVGANNTLNAFATTLYPTEIRATGVSWASSFGRLVGAIGPYVGGILLATMAVQPVFLIFAIPAVCGAISVLLLARVRGGLHRPDAAQAGAKA